MIKNYEGLFNVNFTADMETKLDLIANNEIDFLAVMKKFNDYLEKPISRFSLASVLTRWLWQRFEADSTEEFDKDNRFSAQYAELNELITDGEKLFNERNFVLFSFCLKAPP